LAFRQPAGARIAAPSVAQLPAPEAIASETSRRDRTGTSVALSSFMLRILRFTLNSHRVVLILQGLIVAEWADLLEGECLELRQSGLHVALDLSRVTFIGRSGLEVLCRLAHSGVRIKGCSPLVADMLEQEGLKVDRMAEDVNDRTVPWKRGDDTDA
jgi:anti-anti-sigma regulatory factor